MRSFGKFAIAVALAAALLPAAPRAQSAHAADLYQQARARETDIRKELDAKTSSASDDVVARMRTLARTYEDLWRLFPTSPYSDDALWYGAMLSADAFWQTGDPADRTRALRMFQALTSKFPTSSLVKRVSPQVTRLESAKATEPIARPTPTPSPQAVQPALPATPAAAPATPAVPTRTATISPSVSATLTAIRREVLPDVLRVTLQLEREPEFNSERIDGPPRVFIDMQNTRASESIRDASLAFNDDVVRQIRVGRQLNGRIRVVLDLSGTAKYSVYTLYNPFRIVVDFDRKLPGTPSPVQQPPPQRAAIQPPPASAPPSAPPAARTSTGSNVEPPVARTLPGSPGEANKPRPTSQEAPRPASPEPPRPTPPDAARPASPGAADTNKPRATNPEPAAPKPAVTTAVTTAAPAVARTATPEKPRPIVGRGPEPGDTFIRPAAPPTPSTAPAGTPAPPAATAPPVPPAANSGGSFSLSRQLGLGIGRIVIDPGHGGHDPGAQTKGLSEAEVTLDIALRLEKLFTKQPGVQVVLTRRDDTFVQLQERTAIANRAGADLFLSIHANANEDSSLRGIETYFLNLSPDPEAARIVARENASSSKTMHDFEDIVKAIALNDKIDESRDFATLVQASLYEKLLTSNRETRNLGVKQAPFMVLIGATMPSVLAEISFMTNRQDAALLKTEKYRQQIAEALYQGVMRYQQALKKGPAIALQDRPPLPDVFSAR